MGKLKMILALLVLALSGSLCLAQNTALVIIDMQPYYVTLNGFENNHGNPERLQSVLDRQIQLIALAKKNQKPILILERTEGGKTIEEMGHANRQLLQAVGKYKNAKFFIKTGRNMFSIDHPEATAKIVKFLDKYRVSNLIATGANGGACVNDSIRGSLDLGYKVWADGNGIIDFNFAEFILPYSYNDGQIYEGFPENAANLVNFHQTLDTKVIDKLLD